MTLRVKVTGISGMKINLARVRTTIADGMERGIKKAAKHLVGASQKVVPVDTGFLKSSVFIEDKGRGFDAEATVGYGAPYALIVHEDLVAKHASGTSAKYLEGPQRRERTAMRKIMEDEVHL